jgi:hypothetical protein
MGAICTIIRNTDTRTLCGQNAECSSVKTKWHVNLELGFIQLAESVTFFGIFRLKSDISAKPAEFKPVEVFGDKKVLSTVG